jgi:Rrf2 family protein
MSDRLWRVSSNKQFALAVHILIMLAVTDSGCLNSQAMAQSANANAVSIRRALARFREAGYVTSRPGTGGGTQLARDPAQMTLADVWRIVYGQEPVLGAYEGDPDCPVGSRIQPMLMGIDDRARHALEDELSKTTIAQLARGMPGSPETPRVA